MRPRQSSPLATTRVIGHQHERTEVDFNDLRDANMGGASMANVTLMQPSGTILTDATLLDVSFPAGVDGSVLDGATGQRVMIEHVARDSRFDSVRVTGFAVARETVVERCSFQSASIPESRWAGSVQVQDTSFRWARMQRSVFDRHVTFENCDFSGCNLTGAVFAGLSGGKPTFIRCEFDLADFSGVDLRNAHMSETPWQGRIVFVDADTIPPLNPGELEPTDAGREFMTCAMTDEQYLDYTDALGTSEVDLREALDRLSPAFIPVYQDGTVGTRGELLRKALASGEVDKYAAIQAEVWEQSLEANPMLVTDPGDLYYGGH